MAGGDLHKLGTVLLVVLDPPSIYTAAVCFVMGQVAMVTTTMTNSYRLCLYTHAHTHLINKKPVP